MVISNRYFFTKLFFVTTFFSIFLLLLSHSALANTLLTPTTSTNTVLDTGLNPYGVAVGDIDGDGYDEIAVANFNGDNISVFNYQGGSWITNSYTTKINSSSSNPITLDIGDVTGDGSNDIVVADEWNHRVIVYPNNTTGGFSIPTFSFSTGATSCGGTHLFDNPHDVVVGDFNGDNYKDFAVSNFDLGYKKMPTTYSLGNSGYEEMEFSPIEAPSVKIDCVYHAMVTTAFAQFKVYKFINSGWELCYDGLPSSAQIDDIGNCEKFKVVWISTDATVDFQITYIWDLVNVFIQKPSVSGLRPDKFFVYGYDKSGENDHGYALGVGDLNFDGKKDDLVAPFFKYPPEGTAYMNYYLRRATDSYRTDENQLFYYNDIDDPARVSGLMGSELVDIDVADLNGDTRDDLAIADYRNNRIDVLPQSKMNWFDTIINYPVAFRPNGLACGDVNDDFRADVVVSNGESDLISVLAQKPYSPLYAWTDPLEQSKTFTTPYVCTYEIGVGNFYGDLMNETTVVSATQNKLMIFNQTLPYPPLVSSESEGFFSTTPAFSLTAPDDLNGIFGYYWGIDQSQDTVPTGGFYYAPASSDSDTTSMTADLPLSDGSYWFHVVSLDRADHLGVSAAHYPVYIDRTAPTGSIAINGGALYTNTTNVTLSFAALDSTSGSGLSQMIVSNDSDFKGREWESFATAKSWTLTSGDGTKTVNVKFKDNAGNISEVYSSSILLDTKAPTCSIIINDGEDYTNVTNVTLKLDASDPSPGSGVSQMMISESSTFPGGIWGTYVKSRSWTLSDEDGIKTLYVKFKDNAGNVSILTSDWIVLDTIAPAKPDQSKVFVIQNIPGKPDQVQGKIGAVEGWALVAVYADAGLTTLLGYDWAKQDGSFDPIDIGDNLCSDVYVTETDLAGNKSPAIVLTNDVISSSAPSLNSIPSITNSGSLNITGTAEPGVRVSVYGDYVTLGTAIVASDGTFLCSVNLSEGLHKISAKATDLAGNQSDSSASQSITVDKTSPIINTSKLTLSQNSPGSPDSVSGSAGCVEGNSQVEVFSDSSLTQLIDRVSAASDGSIPIVDIGDNKNVNVYLRATDSAGNSSSMVTLSNDISAPDLGSASLEDNSFSNQTTVSISGPVSDSSLVTVTINGAAATVSGGSYYGTVTLQANQVNKVLIKAVDVAGNSSEITRTVRIDTIEPEVNIINAKEGSYLKGLANINLTFTDTGGSGIAIVKCYVDDSHKITFSSGSKGSLSLKTKLYSNGSHTLRVVATDNAGNSTSESTKIYVDNFKPVIKSLRLSPNPFRPSLGQKITVIYSLREAFSTKVDMKLKIYLHRKLVKSLSFSGKKANEFGAKSKTIWDGRNSSGSIVPQGAYWVVMTVRDQAGNKTNKIFKVTVKR